MDLPPPARGPADGREAAPPGGPAVPDPGSRTGSAREGELEWRLSQLEAGLRHIDRRLEKLEESIGQTVARETQAVAHDLRRTVSELGRRLVLELPQVLARHRDEIVAELRPPEPQPAPEPVDGPAADPDGSEADGRSEPAEGPGLPPAADDGEPPGDLAGAPKRRRRVHGLRRGA